MLTGERLEAMTKVLIFNKSRNTFRFYFITIPYLKKAYSPYDKNLLTKIVDSGLPLMIGEFSNKHPDSSAKEQFIDAKKIMK